jgi:predicted RNA-binding Zn-ribbon protein involved in translation (DUF1610 family)
LEVLPTLHIKTLKKGISGPVGSDISEIINSVNEGLIPPLAKKQEGFPNFATLPDEELTWIGTVDTDILMFGRQGGKTGAFGVLIGVSPYRVVFLLETGTFSSSFYSKSFWFEVEFEGEIWQRGKVRKKEYTSLSLSPPKLKKGLASRTIEIVNHATRSNGKVDKTFESTLSSLKWLNPKSKKYEGRKGEQLFDQLTEAYENRRPVSLKMLMLLILDPEVLEDEFFAPSAAEGKAIKTTISESTQVENVVEIVQEVPLGVEEIAKTTLTCPNCDHEIRVGIKFCGVCGQNLSMPAEVVPKADAEQGNENEGNEAAAEQKLPTCTGCRESVETSWKICPHCGVDLPRRCLECRELVDCDWVACAFCGAVLVGS